MGKENLLPVLAFAILLIGCLSALYVNATVVDTKTIKINDNEYTLNEIFNLVNKRTIFTSEGEKTGVALDDLIIKTNSNCSNCKLYTFKGNDGYQQTVTWEYLKKGILTQKNRIYFSETDSFLWVRNIVEIEVR